MKKIFPVSLKELKKEKLSKLVHEDEDQRASAIHDAREEVLKKMDSIHAQKRKEKDALFEKENPDWIPTRKLRGGSR